MDDFKKKNVKYATKEDYNAKDVVEIKNRNKIGKKLRRYSRRKLKQELNNSDKEE